MRKKEYLNLHLLSMPRNSCSDPVFPKARASAPTLSDPTDSISYEVAGQR